MGKKTLLLLVTSLRIGGQERVAIESAKALSLQYAVEIVAFYKAKNEFDSPVPVHYLGIFPSHNIFSKSIGQLKRIWKLAKIRREKNAAYVYSFGTSVNITNAFSGLVSPGLVISSIHEFTTVRKHPLDWFVYRNSDAVICISKAMKGALTSLYPKLGNIVVIHNGYDIAEIVKKSEKKLPLETPTYQFVAMGRLEPVKGFDRLIKAFALVLKQIPNASLALIGGGSLEHDLKALAQVEGVQDAVHFLGMQPNPFSYLKQGEIFVLSSRNEGFPNALVEALGCGLAIVAIDCMSGPKEILSQEYNPLPVKGVQVSDYGLLCEMSTNEEQNIKILAEGMIKLNQNRHLLREYKDKAVNRAIDFSLEVYQEELIALLRRVDSNHVK